MNLSKIFQIVNKHRKVENETTGVVVIFDSAVCGWMNELRDPQKWEPGCIAVDIDSRAYIARGGNAYDGASTWVAL